MHKISKKGKIENLMTSPLGPNFGKNRNFENFEFWEPPLRNKNISLKHLKIPKNHLKTTFFYSTEVLKVYIYIWENPENLASPPLMKKSTF